MRSTRQRRAMLQIDATLAALHLVLTSLASASQKLDANRREGWLEALDALWRFLDTLDRPDLNRTKVPIATLMAALQDLDRGTVDPGLMPRRPETGRPPDGYDTAVTRAIAAACMHFLLEARRSKNAAAQAVARALIKHGIRLGQRDNVTTEQAGNTIGKWRERLEEGGDNPRAVEHYQHFKEKHRYPHGTSADSIESEFPQLISEALAGRIKRESD